MVRDSARAFSERNLAPIVRESNRHERYERGLIAKFGEAGLLGPTIHGYGCPGVSYVAYGLIAREVERVDSAYRSAFSVQSSLVMYPVWAYGTEAQRLLPAYLFDTYPIARVQAETDVTNLAEQRSLEKAGFTREGILRQAQWRTGARHDLVMYSKLRGE